ncbi:MULTISPECIES: DUF2889 domain-containing protein [unclassified Paraburkholderia]|uniref:DUF2889 domain-containing protein n=1 Tax=unclassified Paraburkholderia TaxID=2615204 RepID=UPI002AB5F338|nr:MULTISPECIES: DUF2889 domain-containing protein [unclassified Paraburkholderia]
MSTNDHANGPARKPLHTRQITCDVYESSNGSYEIEARMVDCKSAVAVLPFRTVEAGEIFHDMRITMRVSADFVIEHVEARSEAAPTPYCRDINPAYAALAGLRIAPRFKERARSLIGGVNGCTHLSDLLGPLATTVMQASFGRMQTAERLREVAEMTTIPKPRVIDTCYAYRADGEAARVVWPPEKRTASDPGTGQRGTK